MNARQYIDSLAEKNFKITSERHSLAAIANQTNGKRVKLVYHFEDTSFVLTVFDGFLLDWRVDFTTAVPLDVVEAAVAAAAAEEIP